MKKSAIISLIFTAVVIIALVVVLSSKKADAPQTDQKSEANTSSSKTKQNKATQPAQPGQYMEYSTEALAKTKGQKVLFFHAPWCPQCRSIEKSILEDKASIPSGITIFKVDYDSNQSLRQKYDVTIQTTFVKVDDSANLIDKYVAYDEPTIDSVARNFLSR